MFDVETARQDFPILSQEIDGKPLVYLDNGATTQVPLCVTDRIAEHYRCFNGNVHRGSHHLSIVSTQQLEAARKRVARFVGAPDPSNIVFTRGTTGAVNLVAAGLRNRIGTGDAIVATALEHHSNFVPWQQLCREKGADFRIAMLTESGELDIEDLERLLELKPKVVAVTCCSNVTGAITPIDEICRLAHDAGALVLLDGAQIMRHRILDAQAIDCDFLAFSGHKMMAGTGIGVLYGKREALELLTPSEFGGEMVEEVTSEQSVFADLPLRFEAGTPNYVGAIALATAMNYLEGLGREQIAAYEDDLVSHAAAQLESIQHVTLIGMPAHRSGCVSFIADGVHHHELCALLDKEGIALRSGNNCARPVMDAFGLTGVARMSPAFYNTREEVDAACTCIEQGIAMLRNVR